MKKVSIGRITLLVACLFIPLLTSATNSFEGDQTSANRTSLELFGGRPVTLAVGGDGTVYAALNSPNGVFVLNDDGDHWRSLQEGLDLGTPLGLVVADDPATAFVLAGVSLYRTQDSGGSWEEVLGSREVSNYAQVISYGNGRLFVPVRDGTIDISSDNGETFTNVAIADTVTMVSSMSAAENSDAVYALVHLVDDTRALFYSPDGGVSWTESVAVSTSTNSVIVKPDNGDFVVLNTNNAITYSTSGVTGTFSSLTTAVGQVQFDGDRIYVGKYYTDNTGGTWTEMIESNGVSQLSGTAIGINPANSSNVLISSNVGIAATSDGGVTWVDLNDGLMGVTVDDIAQSVDEETVILATPFGLAKTTNFSDDQPTWTFPIVIDSGNVATYSVWIDPDDTNRIVVGTSFSIYYSIDGGENWIDADQDIHDGSVRQFVYQDGSLYAAYGNTDPNYEVGGVLMSTDKGETWSSTGLSDVVVNTLAIDNAGHLYAGVGLEQDSDEATRGVFTYDGSTWSQVSGDISGELVHDVIVVDDVVFAVSGETSAGGVFRSTDSGTTWEDVTGNGLEDKGWYHAIAYEPNHTDTLYVSTARPAGTGYIYKSTDGGDSWSEFYVGLTDEEFNTMLFDGLSTGTNTGMYSLFSKASLTLTKKKLADNTYHITARIRDVATNDVLTQRKGFSLYIRHKKTGEWKLLDHARTNDKGKIVFDVSPARTSYYQLRWNPKAAADKDSYGTAVKKSNTIKIKK